MVVARVPMPGALNGSWYRAFVVTSGLLLGAPGVGRGGLGAMKTMLLRESMQGAPKIPLFALRDLIVRSHFR
jgi:hypothetical protein